MKDFIQIQASITTRLNSIEIINVTQKKDRSKKINISENE